MKKIFENKKYRRGVIGAAVLLALVFAFLAGAYVDNVNFGAHKNNAPMGGWDKVENGSGALGDVMNGGYGSGGTANGTTSGTAPEENRKIIKTVTETVQTDAFSSFIASLKSFVIEEGGRIDSERASGENYYSVDNLRTAHFVIRIPAEKLSDFTARIDGIGVISYYSEQKTDVTEAYIDVESRISVLEAKETSLLSMLSAAETVSDLLEIDKRLTDVQSELASLRAQKESYDGRIEYSTVTLTVNEVKRLVTENPTFGESVRDEFLRSLDDIGGGFERLGVLLIGNLLYLVIFAAALAVVVPVIKLLIRKRKKAPQRENSDEETNQNTLENTREETNE